ncbi:unnamed protein product [Onchocerca flexuosa]|uniref:PDZ domain-containing protein n=1 Tax=Onchocerca flexuosa TaxID=387005 RepID=A0A183H0J4_9BILA|nr:unnamed protein product [Onchocerca flexuosa]
MADVKSGDLWDVGSERTEDSSMKTEFEKEDDSGTSVSSNEDFEIIGDQARISGHVANVLFCDLQQKRATESETLTCTSKTGRTEEENEIENKSGYSCFLWKMMFLITVGIITSLLQLRLKCPESADIAHYGTPIAIFKIQESTFKENEHHDETLKETIARQQQIIKKLNNQLKSCTPLDVYNLPVRVEEERATAFERKDGFNYFFVIVDWKKSNRGKAQQHLHLAFKQSNSSIYVYDHGPLSGKYFTVGDRIIDIDGITFIRAVDLRDRILWSHHNKDHFTSIIERPATKQAINTVLALLQPSLSSFSVVLSA